MVFWRGLSRCFEWFFEGSFKWFLSVFEWFLFRVERLREARNEMKETNRAACKDHEEECDQEE